MTYRGKLRIIAHKTDENDFEDMEIESFDDCFVTDVAKLGEPRVLDYELIHNGLHGFEDQIKELLKGYTIDAYVEILANAHIEYFDYDTPDGREYEAESWLDQIRHRGLTEEQVEMLFPHYEEDEEDK